VAAVTAHQPRTIFARASAAGASGAAASAAGISTDIGVRAAFRGDTDGRRVGPAACS